MTELTMAANTHEKKRQGRGTLLLLIAMFTLPLLVVAAMYQFQWRPVDVSHGKLVSPPRPLQPGELQTLHGKVFGTSQWQGKWNLVYVARHPCATACEAQLHDVRQVHAALGKEIGRVQRILLAPADGMDENLDRIQGRYPDLIILAGPATARLAGQFETGSQDDIYLVDPLGNLMMRYPPGYQARGMYKDLMRLMTYSWVG